jgi:hypothetical protein
MQFRGIGRKVGSLLLPTAVSKVPFLSVIETGVLIKASLLLGVTDWTAGGPRARSGITLALRLREVHSVRISGN